MVHLRDWAVVGIAVAAVLAASTVAVKYRGPSSVTDSVIGLEPGRSAQTGALGDVDQAPAAQRALLPSEPVRFISVDTTGEVWLRLRVSGGREDRIVAIDASENRRVYASLRAAVQANYRAILQRGDLSDFWAVDSSDNVWVGPAFFNGRIWQLAAGPSTGLSSLTYEDRVAVDAAGNAWVPYRIQEGCAQTTDCELAGIAAFNARGEMVSDIVLEVMPDLQRRDLPFVRFEGDADGGLVALGSRAAYRLPITEPLPYPGMDFDPTSGTRNAGFGSASAITPEGQLSAFTRVEPPRGATAPVLSELTWKGASWQSNDLGGSPLFNGHTGSRFVTAAVYDFEGRLWVAASSAELAARAGRQWGLHFNAANSPVDALITDLAVAPDGTLWVGTTKGARTYLNGDWRTAVNIFVPRLDLFCVGPFGDRGRCE